MAVLRVLVMDYDEGEARIWDDRGGSSGDVIIKWYVYDDKVTEEAHLEHQWYLSDLRPKGYLMRPRKYDPVTGKRYLPLPEEVWEDIRDVIRVFF